MKETSKKPEARILDIEEFVSLDMRLLSKRDLNAQQKILLSHVISMLNYNDKYFASNPHIEFVLGLNQKTISKAFTMFKEKGWMEVGYTVLNVRIVTIDDDQKATLLAYLGTHEEYKDKKEANDKKHKMKKNGTAASVAFDNSSPKRGPQGIKVQVPSVEKQCPSLEGNDERVVEPFGQPYTLEYFFAGKWWPLDKPLEDFMHWVVEYEEMATPELIKRACEGEEVGFIELDFRYKQETDELD